MHCLPAAVFLKAMFIFPYAWLRERVAIVPDAAEYTTLHHILGFLFVDHAYYWCAGQAERACGQLRWSRCGLNARRRAHLPCRFHRTAHMSNFGWAGHVTHHSSCDYNFSTALRQGVGESTVRRA